MPHFRANIGVENKLAEEFDPVTIADKAVEEAIRALIHKHFPDHGILGEEFDNVALDAEHVWILDPIDGTRAFISGLPTWGTLIGHKVNGRAKFGMMSQPFTAERYFGDGKSSQYKGPGGPQNLMTRGCKSLSDATLFTTSPHQFSKSKIDRFKAIEQQVKLSRYGMDCYAYCMVARGSVDLVIEDGLEAYDIAALIPIIEGAGGRVTTWDGGNAVDGGSIVACGDPSLHEQVLKLLSD